MRISKSLVPRRKEPYVVSPWALTWDDENYYLIAYDEEAGCIKHFRVDKLKSIKILKDKRIGKDKFKELDLAKYSKMSFGMFHGEPTKVRIAFQKELVGVFLDRFGRDISIHPSDKKDWYETYVDVAVSDQFLGWVFALGSQVQIMGPENVVKKFKEEINEIVRQYK